MLKRRTIREAWDEFERLVLSRAAPLQRDEMRKAFYSGAATAFSLLTGQLDPGEEPTQADLDYMESIHQELEQFSKQLKRGLN